MNSIINNAFKYKNGATRYTHIKVGRNKRYFTGDPLNGDNKYTANDICKMIQFLVDNNLVDSFLTNGWHSYTNCVPLLADLFLYSYKNVFSDKLIKKAKENLLESSIYHTIILKTLSLSMIKNLRSYF